MIDAITFLIAFFTVASMIFMAGYCVGYVRGVEKCNRQLEDILDDNSVSK